MKKNRFSKSAAVVLLVLGSGGIASARYLQPDPIGRDPANYRYAADSPLKYVDPDGRDISIWETGDHVFVTIDTKGCCAERAQGSETWNFGPAPIAGPLDRWFGWGPLRSQTVPGYLTPDQPPRRWPFLPGPQRYSLCCEQDAAAAEWLGLAAILQPDYATYDNHGAQNTFSPDQFTNAVLEAARARGCSSP